MIKTSFCNIRFGLVFINRRIGSLINKKHSHSPTALDTVPLRVNAGFTRKLFAGI